MTKINYVINREEYFNCELRRKRISDMAFWLDLMFGNAIGLLSMIVIFSTIGIVSYLMWMFYTKSADPES
ncbi:Conserved hypothetical protein [Shewanella piezotolerans WP3]|uniref:DUF3149 domain-containing protein n=1 Tax=Shewanella piezotolerans (strain WP3 / JCM 13877) TaxID=225849 RepID=B8CUG1_SHEPW|nr:Conserved hypothetical protein [Shewanella piezotolerans WP3]